jgi:PAS domain-containing protein
MVEPTKFSLKVNRMHTGLRPRQSHSKQNGRSLGASERRQLEAELRASEDRFRLVLENSPSPIGVFDQTGSLRYYRHPAGAGGGETAD